MKSEQIEPVDLRAHSYNRAAETSEEAVQEQLAKICSSVQFRSSRRCLAFLDFVVKSALRGETGLLKERTIGVEAFQRSPNYDTNQDPVVRGTASEVRKRLAQYYQSAGHEAELRIDLAPGSYIPSFLVAPAIVKALPESAPEVTTSVAVEPQPHTTRVAGFTHVKRWEWKYVALASVLLLSAVMALARLNNQSAQQSLLDRFFAPMLDGPGEVLLCVGQPTVFNVLGSLHDEALKYAAGKRPSKETVPSVDRTESVNLSQIVPNSDRYLALGDARCLANLAAYFSRKGRAYRIRGGESTTFADLRENPAVLIGAFTNEWNMRLASELRYTFARNPDGTSPHVCDRFHPLKRDWKLTNEWPNWNIPIDYAIVSRIFDSTSGKVVIAAAGITHFGTAAAGEFLTTPDYLGGALSRAPLNWQLHNCQFVLMTKVVGDTAGPPQVVASYFW